MNLLFTTGWGALYMVLVIGLMGWAFTYSAVRVYAGVIIGLWVADRIAVNSLEPLMALLYLAYAYTLSAITLFLFYWGRTSVVVGSMLLFTAVAFALGRVEALSWDVVGSIQEGAGLLAMIFIIWRRGDDIGSPFFGSNLATDHFERDHVANIDGADHTDSRRENLD